VSRVIHKFGGSSLADEAGFRQVGDIVRQTPEHCVGVVGSACGGVTDDLLALVEGCRSGSEAGVDGALEALLDRHEGISRALLSDGAADRYVRELAVDLAALRGVLQTVALLRDASPAIRDHVAGYGELWSTRLLAAYLGSLGLERTVRWVDAREVLVADPEALGPVVRWEASRRRLAAWRADTGATEADLHVIPGFVASDSEGLQTTLGRNGSDLSAAIFGVLFEVDEVVIWTDVPGVMSADPRRVPDARVVEGLSYDEAMELAYFGAKVLHPGTLAPAMAREIPVRIRQTFAPELPGTLIGPDAVGGRSVKGLSSIDGIGLLNLEGAGMIGVPGTAHRLFGALREADISVTLISQGSSEHSICVAVPEDQLDVAERVVRRAFDVELREGLIQDVEVTTDLSVLAVVGDGMAGTHGTSAKVFEALGRVAVNVRAIAQGASERNISVVVNRSDSARALRAVHSGFHLSPHTLSIGLIGPGTVGAVFLQQLATQVERFRRDFDLDLQLRGVANSRTMALHESGMEIADWATELAQGDPLDLDAFVNHVAAEHLPHAVLIDCTADAGVASNYEAWLSRGIHVVTPNKKANSGPIEPYRRIQGAGRRSGALYLYEATVGAGLPVVLTLRDLRETGDRVRTIEGIFSGTLAYLFNRHDGTVPFSQIVREAREKGFTEPDPREDLSGLDVARKLIILGREMGLSLELDDVEVESLVPSGFEDLTVPEFLDRLPEIDASMNALLEETRAAGQVLRYVGRLTAEGEASVGVTRIDEDHSFAHVALTDNIVRFATDRYSANPLIVQGPGAGAEVTAAGVFGDLLRLASYLGTRL
jgi:aspartokinase/homoserine dehydrogenase 1